MSRHEVEHQVAETTPLGPKEHGKEAGMTETQMLKEGHPYCCIGGGALEVSVDASELGGDHPGAGRWTLKRATHRPGLLPGVIL